jgi:voltage-gated potassium channel
MAGCCLAITALGSSQLLYEFEIFDRYGEALHAAALATITGEPIAQPDGFAKVLDVALAGYSVVVFAALAATLGAYSSAKGRRRQTRLP